jgi:exosome complex RNA-binding protein Rrp42 (RNase PH superfamily)
LTSLGETKVVTGINLEIGTPSPSAPSHGEIDVSVSFSPLCGRQYNTGGKIMYDEFNQYSASANSYADPQSIESFVKRTVLTSNMIDLSQLCVSEGKAAWKVNICCVVVNHDGNIVDCVLLGIVSALGDLRLQAVKMQKIDGEEVVRLLSDPLDATRIKRSSQGLKFEKIVIPLTIGIFQGKLLVDPDAEEERLCDGQITVVIDMKSLTENNGVLQGNILNLNKSGGGVFLSAEEIAASVQLALGRAKELTSIISI